MLRETLLILSFIGVIYGFEPSCSTCKFFIPHQNNPNLGLCNVFKERFINDSLLKNFATHCRNDEKLCGKSGFLYEEQKKDEDLLDDKKEMIDNLCCGEVNEKSDIEELEKLEKEFVEIYQKMRLNNTRRFYKTTKDLYKLFKNK